MNILPRRELFPIVKNLKDASRIFVHGQSAVPYALLGKFTDLMRDARELEFMHLHLEGSPAHFEERFRDSSRINSLFVSPGLRSLVDGDRVDYTPMFLSEMPRLFKSGLCPVDVALVHLSPPDRFGYCTFGVSLDIARAAVDHAKIVVAQINPKMPKTHGDTLLHMDRIDHFIEVEDPLPESKNNTREDDPILTAIGRNVAELVENGSTLQLGIGAIPDAVLRALRGHRHLGLHSEMWSNGVLELIKCGAIDNSRKVVHPGKVVSCFIQGTREVYEFIDDNPSVELYPSDYVNSPFVIARNPKVVAINSAVEVDLTGQVCADSIGHRMVSGVGGQIDFIRGASLASDGKAIIAMTSRAKHGASRLVSSLQKGAGVVTTRADVHFVVTEYGVANLYGHSIGQRVHALLQIAHPEDRDRLKAEWSQICRGKS